MNKQILIAPSILPADFANLAEDVQMLEEAGANFLHLDVMDGHFVPNLTFGAPLIKSLRKHSKLIFDAHLMVANPLHHIENFIEAGADIITLHLETLTNEEISIASQKIRSAGKKFGIAIKPNTNLRNFPLKLIDQFDLILVMSVEPGFGGQEFMPVALERLAFLKQVIEKFGKHIDLQVDGGIDEKIAAQVIKAGANVLVSGSYIYQNPMKNIKKLKLAQS